METRERNTKTSNEYWTSYDDCVGEGVLNRTLQSLHRVVLIPERTSSSLQPTTEPLASLPLCAMQPSTVCEDFYLGFEDSCSLNVGVPVCWAEIGHLPGNLEKDQIQMSTSARKEAPSIFCRMTIDIIQSHPRAQYCQHSFRLNFSYSF